MDVILIGSYDSSLNFFYFGLQGLDPMRENWKYGKMKRSLHKNSIFRLVNQVHINILYRYIGFGNLYIGQTGKLSR